MGMRWPSRRGQVMNNGAESCATVDTSLDGLNAAKLESGLYR